MIIAITGLIGAGKDTIASHLVEKYGYERYSWATPLKDITATLFGWERGMLEGTTTTQREQREQTDEWWSSKLGKNWSPRIALQVMGTEVMRNALHPDIWILAGTQRIAGKQNVVIPDTRFPNEIAAIRDMGGVIWNVERGKLPEWDNDLTEWRNLFGAAYTQKDVIRDMKKYHPNVHPSEYSWHGTKFDAVFYNNSTIDELTQSVDLVVRNQI
jgi:hypothetical protein